MKSNKSYYRPQMHLTKEYSIKRSSHFSDKGIKEMPIRTNVPWYQSCDCHTPSSLTDIKHRTSNNKAIHTQKRVPALIKYESLFFTANFFIILCKYNKINIKHFRTEEKESNSSRWKVYCFYNETWTFICMWKNALWLDYGS